jgi:hypothetical protein
MRTITFALVFLTSYATVTPSSPSSSEPMGVSELIGSASKLDKSIVNVRGRFVIGDTAGEYLRAFDQTTAGEYLEAVDPKTYVDMVPNEKDRKVLENAAKSVGRCVDVSGVFRQYTGNFIHLGYLTSDVGFISVGKISECKLAHL